MWVLEPLGPSALTGKKRTSVLARSGPNRAVGSHSGPSAPFCVSGRMKVITTEERKNGLETPENAIPRPENGVNIARKYRRNGSRQVDFKRAAYKITCWNCEKVEEGTVRTSPGKVRVKDSGFNQKEERARKKLGKSDITS